MISSQYLIIIVLALLSGLTTIIGVLLAYLVKRKKKSISFGIGFSAGIMIFISAFELLPESYQGMGFLKSTVSFLLGGVLIALLNKVIHHSHLVKEDGDHDCRFLRTAYICAWGLIIHDFPEGFALANSYLHSVSFGILISISIALHNIPEEFAIAVPLVLAGKKKRLLFKMAFISALAEPIGATLGLFAVSFHPSFNLVFLSFAAGAMLYIAFHELIPLARTYNQIRSSIMGLVGSLVIFLLLHFFMT